MTLDSTTDLLRHFLATLAYRTQKALRDAPPSFGDFAAGNGIRTENLVPAHPAPAAPGRRDGKWDPKGG